MISIYVKVLYHSCNYNNRSGTRRLIDYDRGHNCLFPYEYCWRETKSKYLFRKNYYTRKRRKKLSDIFVLCGSCKPEIIEDLTKGNIVTLTNSVDREHTDILRNRFNLIVYNNFISDITV